MSLGQVLAWLRAAARIPPDLAASSLGWSPDRLHAVERDKASVTVAELRGILAVYGITDPAVVNRFIGNCPRCSADEETTIILCAACRCMLCRASSGTDRACPDRPTTNGTCP